MPRRGLIRYRRCQRSWPPRDHGPSLEPLHPDFTRTTDARTWRSRRLGDQHFSTDSQRRKGPRLRETGHRSAHCRNHRRAPACETHSEYGKFGRSQHAVPLRQSAQIQTLLRSPRLPSPRRLTSADPLASPSRQLRDPVNLGFAPKLAGLAFPSANQPLTGATTISAPAHCFSHSKFRSP